MSINSKYEPLLTLEYIKTEAENRFFDRKSSKIKPSDLSQHISAFANAAGGTIVIGIDDRTRAVEGIQQAGEERINEWINAPRSCCKPMPKFREEFLEIENVYGEPDRLLLLHIDSSMDQVIRTSSDRTYLRIGDKSVEMLGDNLRNLEYSKGSRYYEDEPNREATIEDLDEDLLREYKERVGGKKLTVAEVLLARGFIKKVDGKEFLSNAAVLLFAKNIQQFYPNCRIRFVRYDGTFAQVGTKINITRDKSIEAPILRIIDLAKDFINTQLREFTMLNMQTGKFQVVPEYPEFAWLEGIVNAVTHREYAFSGSYIKVTMYDDRLEIESPGELPNIVTVDNIQSTRYSRNPRISRVLTEFGWVRELNEGVKRIYGDMAAFFLDEPVYSEPDHCVKLVLRNNIVMRMIRQSGHTVESVGKEIWNSLDEIEKRILTYLVNHGPASRAQLEAFTKKSEGTVRNRLNRLIDIHLVKANGNQYAPGRTYEAVLS